MTYSSPVTGAIRDAAAMGIVASGRPDSLPRRI
jgi:hypothetical protein